MATTIANPVIASCFPPSCLWILPSNSPARLTPIKMFGQDMVQSRHAVAFDSVRLLPAASSHKIYFSHSCGIVVIYPRRVLADRVQLSYKQPVFC